MGKEITYVHKACNNGWAIETSTKALSDAKCSSTKYEFASHGASFSDTCLQCLFSSRYEHAGNFHFPACAVVGVSHTCKRSCRPR